MKIRNKIVSNNIQQFMKLIFFFNVAENLYLILRFNSLKRKKRNPYLIYYDMRKGL